MDLHAFADDRAADWERLGALARQRALEGREADELIRRYQEGAADLAAVKTELGPSLAGDRLSVLLSRARVRFTGPPAGGVAAVAGFFARLVPAALYRLRWLTLVCAAATIGVAAVYALWAIGDPAVLASVGDAELRRRIAEHEFVNYYSENPAASFTGLVWTNNATIAAFCILFGVLGAYVPVVLLLNGQNLGLTSAVMISEGHTDTLLLYIAPHGQLELTAVFVAAAAGLRVFWAWVVPGARTRLSALAEEAQSMVAVAVALVLALFVSGVIEGYVTPQPWPWPVKIGIGSAALAGFLLWMLWAGRRAQHAEAAPRSGGAVATSAVLAAD